MVQGTPPQLANSRQSAATAASDPTDRHRRLAWYGSDTYEKARGEGFLPGSFHCQHSYARVLGRAEVSNCLLLGSRHSRRTHRYPAHRRPTASHRHSRRSGNPEPFLGVMAVMLTGDCGVRGRSSRRGGAAMTVLAHSQRAGFPQRESLRGTNRPSGSPVVSET